MEFSGAQPCSFRFRLGFGVNEAKILGEKTVMITEF
jgi:hypothetical protein